MFFFFSSRRRHTRSKRDWSSDVCSSDLAGESHGEALTAVIDGVPAGLPLTEADINGDLARRQRGYGRGGRMKIERDQVHILSGVRWGATLGSPITLNIANRDWENW